MRHVRRRGEQAEVVRRNQHGAEQERSDDGGQQGHQELLPPDRGCPDLRNDGGMQRALGGGIDLVLQVSTAASSNMLTARSRMAVN